MSTREIPAYVSGPFTTGFPPETPYRRSVLPTSETAPLVFRFIRLPLRVLPALAGNITPFLRLGGLVDFS